MKIIDIIDGRVHLAPQPRGRLINKLIDAMEILQEAAPLCIDERERYYHKFTMSSLRAEIAYQAMAPTVIYEDEP